jgi:energy-coupling factor transport system ATP-binding protein
LEIVCRDVWYRYPTPDAPWILRGIDLELRQGEKVALIGPAGSGKTTLIQLLDALSLPSKGAVSFDGQEVQALARRKELVKIRRRIGVLFQFPEHQFFEETAYDELVFSLRNFYRPTEAEIEATALRLLEPMGLDLERLRQTSPFSLSSGEKRKLALASALMTGPEVLILDEPTAGMDGLGRSELLRVLGTLEDTSVVLVTHNLEDFLEVVDRVVGLVDGRVVFDLPRDQLVSRLESIETAGIELPLVLRVQAWLAQAGWQPEQPVFGMAALLELLDQHLTRHHD